MPPDELSRNDVFEIFKQETDIVNKFIAAMVWGYDEAGYGAYRTAVMLSQMKNTDDHLKVEEHLENAYKLVREGNRSDAYKILDGSITQLGPAFATKLLYFASLENHRGKGPRNFSRTDAHLREEVCELFLMNPDLDPADIVVVVNDGVVTLEGRVHRGEDRYLAEDLAYDEVRAA